MLWLTATPMPSLVHDGMVRLFHARPDLAPTLVRDFLGVALPAHADVRIGSADLTDIAPAPRHADAVVVLSDGGRAVHAQVVEVQLGIDPDKLLSWPAYATNLRGRLGCDVELLVVTPHRAVARWAARPIRLGPSNAFRALVAGPDRLPCITQPEQARAHPELAVLSAMAHGHGPRKTAAQVATAALSAAAGLQDERALLYSDLVWVALSDAARGALEALMRSGEYEYQSEFARRYIDEGMAKGKAELVARQVQLKFGTVPADVQARIASASVEELDRWGDRILTAATLEDVLR